MPWWGWLFVGAFLGCPLLVLGYVWWARRYRGFDG
jgi:hypothetical protein